MFYDNVVTSAAYIQKRADCNPETGIILGSGLGGLVDIIADKKVIPYKKIPSFPQISVEGHAGNLVLGTIGEQQVIAMQGRFHFYEGYTMKELTYPLYVMKELGVKNLIVTNAAGGVNKEFKLGDLMIIDDYMNLFGINPLIGKNDERFGPRFPDMTEAYSKELIKKAEQTAAKMNIEYQHGVYMLFTGPSYETAAEIGAAALLGADAVGMSTVPETIVANYLGMKVLGISCITNMATGIASEKHTHESVMATANKASETLCSWVRELLVDWHQI